MRCANVPAGRSKLDPSFFRSGGARLIVVRPIENLNPWFSVAVFTRSRDSFTASEQTLASMSGFYRRERAQRQCGFSKTSFQIPTAD